MPAPQTARAQIRQAAKVALQAAVTGGNFAAGIQSPGDWNQPPEVLPAIQLRAPDEHKQSGGKTVPNFELKVTLEIQAFAALADTEEDAQDAIELLDAWIEQTLFTDKPLLDLIEQIESVETTTTIAAEGEQHAASVEKRIVVDTFEHFEPTAPGLTEITLTRVVEAFTSQAAAAGGNVLTFAAAPTSIGPNWLVLDRTTAGAIAAGITVIDATGTTVTLSAPIAAPGVALGDRIVFQPPNLTLDIELPQ
jgi:hypothetical protein